jgi:hypothetical protein
MPHVSPLHRRSTGETRPLSPPEGPGKKEGSETREDHSEYHSGDQKQPILPADTSGGGLDIVEQRL